MANKCQNEGMISDEEIKNIQFFAYIPEGEDLSKEAVARIAEKLCRLSKQECAGHLDLESLVTPCITTFE